MISHPPATAASLHRSGPDACTPVDIRQRVLDYYGAATQDYRAWSRQFNMHFGFWRAGINPLRREAMLQEMNLQALARMALPRQGPVRIADLGGGTGATARAAVAARPGLLADVVTIVPQQVEIGAALNAAAGQQDAIRMVCADYVATGLPEASYDAVCLLESACHAQGATKSAVLREAHRLLKPGGRLVMVDAMLRKPWFAVKELAKARRRLPACRWRHIVASLLTPFLGLRTCTFMYGVVVARKAG